MQRPWALDNAVANMSDDWLRIDSEDGAIVAADGQHRCDQQSDATVSCRAYVA